MSDDMDMFAVSGPYHCYSEERGLFSCCCHKNNKKGYKPLKVYEIKKEKKLPPAYSLQDDE